MSAALPSFCTNTPIVQHLQRCNESPSPREFEVHLAKKDDMNNNGETSDPQPCLGPDRIWAIGIGIDGYPSYPLRGCVADALAIKQYYIEDLLVPKERIEHLLRPANDSDGSTNDPIPSRKNILSALRNTITNPDIKYGDPIIIFFAGHGSRYPLSDDDYDPDFFDGPRSGAFVPDITDREINTILSQISRTKGHRITFILDCCHAGSVTRALSPGLGVRSAPPLECTSIKDMLLVADENLEDLPGCQSVVSEDWVPDMDSHVIVAACRGDEVVKARRVKGTKVWAGIFTSSLVTVLKSGGLGEGATYVDLIDALPRPSFPNHSQTPTVAGRRKDKRLWYQD
ncbi:uncharacterized protein EV420DRAFT_1478486 [Desarmillaria tabescens]|uniref:Peptidase C14 caspase domain-containing protein n=1 Tax=Armillaria tabescens TaxID=1929756 RepID=A0AA39N817_ARMTA|nr:uncharacterized protein EV420DRAFT_1478486 [Desarmillaria tabescens]KAK0460741.1 hypothetical protein EV420DRAFT_1478486 [Desarmillaria tabescens]